MRGTHLLARLLLGAAILYTVAVVILFNVAAAGVAAIALVLAFAAGLLLSGAALGVSNAADAPFWLRTTSGILFAAYLLTACVVLVWGLVAQPPFG